MDQRILSSTYVWLFYLSAGSPWFSAAGIDVSPLCCILSQLFDQLQTNTSVSPSHYNIAC